MKIRKAYDTHVRFPTIPIGETMTKRSMQAECDINVLMSQYEKSGLISHIQEYGGRYEFLPDSVDYQAALDSIMDAGRAFETLPAALRARFENDPGQFLEFVENPESRKEMIEMGLIEKGKAPEGAVAPPEEVIEQPAAEVVPKE